MRARLSRENIAQIYNKSLFELLFEASKIHQSNHKIDLIDRCTLLSIKTGGCPEDCSYCSQSSRYSTNIEVHKLLDLKRVLQAARKAKESNSTYFCLSAAWRKIKDDFNFANTLEMIKTIRKEVGIKVCCTFGLLTYEQAVQLKEAGISCYNHNLDTSPSFYKKIITSRKYEDRLQTLENVRKANIDICCGGILGLGESHADRIDLIEVLVNLPTLHAVVLNTLVPIKGTPLENQKQVNIWDLVRMVATCRIMMPKTKIRWAGGRSKFSFSEQTLCFLAGINSIHIGEKLLTTPNCPREKDEKFFEILGLFKKEVFSKTLQ